MGAFFGIKPWEMDNLTSYDINDMITWLNEQQDASGG